MPEKLLDLIDACQNTGSKVDFAALRQAVNQQAKKLAELESESTYLSQFKDTLDDAEEAMFFSIERAARVSFRRWRSSVRGNQVHRGDSYDAHLIWATQQEMKQQPVEPVNQVLLDALKAAHSALIDLHPNYSEKAFYAVLEVHNAIKQSQSTKREPLSDEQFKKIKTSLRRQDGFDGDGWDLALKERIEAAHGITKGQ